MLTQRTAIIKRRDSTHSLDEPVLRVTDLSVQYDGETALQGVSFTLQAGDRVAVVGPNGAGKSTLFRTIAGIQRPSQGQISVAGSSPGSIFASPMCRSAPRWTGGSRPT